MWLLLELNPFSNKGMNSVNLFACPLFQSMFRKLPSFQWHRVGLLIHNRCWFLNGWWPSAVFLGYEKNPKILFCHSIDAICCNMYGNVQKSTVDSISRNQLKDSPERHFIVIQCQKMCAITCANINKLKGTISTVHAHYSVCLFDFFWPSININEILSVHAYFHMIR